MSRHAVALSAALALALSAAPSSVNLLGSQARIVTAAATGVKTVPAGEYAGETLTAAIRAEYDTFAASPLITADVAVVIGVEVFEDWSPSGAAQGNFDEGTSFELYGQVEHTTAAVPHSHGFFGAAHASGTMCVAILDQSDAPSLPLIPHDPGIGFICDIPAAVTFLGPEDLVAQLVAQIQSLGLPSGIESPLVDDVNNALSDPSTLSSFIANVDGLRGTHLTNTEADLLVAAAQAIAVALGAPHPVLAPTIVGVDPAEGLASGGFEVRIYGTGFDPLPQVHFSQAQASVTSATPTVLTVLVPPHAAGSVDVRVENDDGQAAVFRNGFTYRGLPGPTIVGIDPADGPTAGGVHVRIHGSDFDALPLVYFGTTAVAVVSATPTVLTVLVPPHAAGSVDVRVENDDGQAAVLRNGFTYLNPPAPTIVGIDPADGPTAGGVHVRIHGSDFDALPLVYLGTTAVVVVSATPTVLTVLVPPHAAGSVDVRVENDDGQAAVLRNGFTYLNPPAPTIVGIDPAEGPTAGGIQVRVHGSDFDAMPLVHFGTTAVSVVSATPTILTVLVPPHAAGPVDVRVENEDGQAAVLRNGFKYVAAGPQVLGLTPSQGPVDGGTDVFISGQGFEQGVQVRFGGVIATSSRQSSRSIAVTTPPGPSRGGVVDVVVTNPDGQLDRATFTYLPPPAPVVTSITPSSGSVAGGTAVTIQGANFLSTAMVRIGTWATGVVVVSDKEIRATTSAYAWARFVDVVVRNPDLQEGALVAGFEYTSPDHQPTARRWPSRLRKR